MAGATDGAASDGQAPGDPDEDSPSDGLMAQDTEPVVMITADDQGAAGPDDAWPG